MDDIGYFGSVMATLSPPEQKHRVRVLTSQRREGGRERHGSCRHGDRHGIALGLSYAQLRVVQSAFCTRIFMPSWSHNI